MKKQSKQQPVIDLDSFNDVSLHQMIPEGTGMALAHLKTLIDSVLNGRAKLNSLLISGKTGLNTHSRAFLQALGLDNINHTYAPMLQNNHELFTFFCTQENDGYIINNIENISNSGQYHLCNILKDQKFQPYNYMQQQHDFFYVPGIVVLTARNLQKVPESIRKCISHIVELENYTPEQLELVILQRCKYASVEIEDEYILQEIVQYGEQDLQKSIWFLRTCIAVMQAEGRQILQKGDIVRAGRLNRLPVIDDQIPF